MNIRLPAIQYNGHIYEGLNHRDVGLAMIAAGVCRPPFPCGVAQGFTTWDLRFVSREEALKIALEAGQITEHCHVSKLFSEDLKEVSL